MSRERQLQDSISFRLSGTLGQRLRNEAEQSNRRLGEVMRTYLLTGVQTLDAQRLEPTTNNAGVEPASAVGVSA